MLWLVRILPCDKPLDPARPGSMDLDDEAHHIHLPILVEDRKLDRLEAPGKRLGRLPGFWELDDQLTPGPDPELGEDVPQVELDCLDAED